LKPRNPSRGAKKRKESYREWSYSFQAEHFENTEQFPAKLIESWLRDDTADAWRHNRMYEAASLLVQDEKNSKWLTIGDGRWGLDSIKLRKIGFTKILASDLAETYLKKSKAQGLIDNYKIINGEEMDFQSKSVDFVFCKESLHHFPLPYKALYEFIRVARKGFLLIEPNDRYRIDVTKSKIKNRFNWAQVKDLIVKFTLQRYTLNEASSLIYNDPSWEPSGNYTHTFSQRDFEKFAYGAGMHTLMFKGLNDHYIEGCEYEVADAKVSDVFAEIVNVITKKNFEMNAGMYQPDLLMIVVFIDKPTELQLKNFEKNKWKIIKLSPNPYF
jgi:ubiquinone/menaquinone biosynthesis C-methylase UbiE